MNKKERKRLAIDCYRESLKNLVGFYENIQLKERHKFVRPIKNSGLSYQKFRDLGFPVSNYLWDTCLDSSDRNKGK